MTRRTGAPRIGLILLTLAGIALASAGLATAVTMSVSAPVSARADLSAGAGGSPGVAPDAGARAAAPTPSPSEEWKPLPVDPAVADRSITDLTDGASTSRVTVDVLGLAVSPGQAGSLVAGILAVPLVIAVAVLVATPRPRRWWRTVVLRRHG